VTLASARTNLVLGLVVLLLVAAVAWLALLGPTLGAIGAAREDLTDRTDTNALLRVRLHALEKRAADLSEVHASARELTTVFPATADQPGFFALIDEAAADAGISPEQITTLSPAAPLPAGTDPAAAAEGAPVDGTVAPLAVQEVTVILTAGYDQARELLARLESMDRAFLVRSLAVVRDRSGGDDAAAGTTTVTITGRTYVAPPLARPDRPRRAARTAGEG
jgi:hypothetical protein